MSPQEVVGCGGVKCVVVGCGVNCVVVVGKMKVPITVSSRILRKKDLAKDEKPKIRSRDFYKVN